MENWVDKKQEMFVKEIFLRENILKWEVDSQCQIQYLFLISPRDEKKIIFLKDDQDLIIKESLKISKESSIFQKNKDEQPEIIISDLREDGSRLILLHEIGHSKHLDLYLKKIALQKKFSYYLDLGQQNMPMDKKMIQMTTYIPMIDKKDKEKVVESYIYLPAKIVEEYLTSWVDSEKRAWQYALDNYRKLKNNGWDLEPNLNDKQIEEIIKKSFEGYQAIVNSMNLNEKDKIKIPSFV